MKINLHGKGQLQKNMPLAGNYSLPGWAEGTSSCCIFLSFLPPMKFYILFIRLIAYSLKLFINYSGPPIALIEELWGNKSGLVVSVAWRERM